MDKILDVKKLKSGYGNVQILNGIDLYVEKNEFVTIIGPNGCGKSTFIKTIFGLCNYFSGDVFFQGNLITKIRSDLLISKGISYVPQVNNVFSSLSVYENLQIGSLLLDKNEFFNKLNYIYDLFPDLYLDLQTWLNLYLGRKTNVSNLKTHTVRSIFIMTNLRLLYRKNFKKLLSIKFRNLGTLA